MKQTLKKLSILCLSLTLLQGCVGYKLGTMLPDDIQSVYIPTFTNRTGEPFLENETTRAVLREIQTDGSLTLAKEGASDSLLEITLISYDLNPLIYEQGNRSRASQYRATIIAELKFTRIHDGKVIAQRSRVKGDAVFDFSGDLTTTKRNAQPAVADDLAHDIVEIIVKILRLCKSYVNNYRISTRTRNHHDS